MGSWATRGVWLAMAGALAAPARANNSISDLAREIGAVDRQEIARLIEQHRAATGHRIVVTTVPNSSAIDLSDFAGGALGALGPEADTAIALVHDRASNTTQVVAGTGLRSRLQDDELYQLQSVTMAPLFNAGDAGGAFREGVTRLMALDVPPPPEAAQPADLPPLTQQQDTMRIAIIGLPLILLAFALWSLWIHLRNRLSRRRARRADARAARERAARDERQAAAAPPPVQPPVSAATAVPASPPPATPRPAAAPLPGFGIRP